MSQAVGIELSPIQAVLFLSGIALSLAIPAAPGAIGTYEGVGVAIITGLGYTPEQGLATILLMRMVTTFPPALIGLVSIWALHVEARHDRRNRSSHRTRRATRRDRRSRWATPGPSGRRIR